MNDKDMTRAEFIERYTSGNEATKELLLRHGRHAIPCSCEQPGCDGWQMAYPEETEADVSEVLS